MVIWGLTLVLVWHLAETRNWRKYFNGEYLINAQGVVSGVRTPQQITLIGSRKWAEAIGVSEQDRKAKYPSLKK
jgi:pyruvate,orthophosphate dikinase